MSAKSGNWLKIVLLLKDMYSSITTKLYGPILTSKNLIRLPLHVISRYCRNWTKRKQCILMCSAVRAACPLLFLFTVTLGMSNVLKLLKNSLEDSTDPWGGQLMSQRYSSARACSCIWSCDSNVVIAQLRSGQLSFPRDIIDGIAKFRYWLSATAGED